MRSARPFFHATGRTLALVTVLLVISVAPAALGASSDTDEASGTSMPNVEPDQLVKTIQEKTFLKAKRGELTFFLGNETIDPFISHWTAGLNVTYHATEVFAFEALFAYSPFLSNIAETFTGEPVSGYRLDLKDLTLELAENASVYPRSSKLRHYGNVGVVYSPLYGKFAFFFRSIVNFDISFMSGVGYVNTVDLDAEAAANSETLNASEQYHFATNFGFGFRAAFNRWAAFRIDGREYFYIESASQLGGSVPGSEELSLKYYFFVQAGFSIFIPTNWR